jgi:hypothetical protein
VNNVLRFTRSGRGSLIVLLGFALLIAVGCSSKGSVNGKVTFKGKPLPGGTVTFTPDAGGGGGSADINPQDGTYKIENLPRGAMKVTVKPYQSTAMRSGPSGAPKDMMAKMKSHLPEGVEMKAPGDVEKESGAKAVKDFPNTYSEMETTSLKYTVKGGPNEYNIDIP